MIIQYFKEISKSGFTFKTKDVFSGGYLNTDSKTE
jgi:pectate lyase